MPVCKRTCWSSDISMPASMPRQRPCTGSCKAGAVVDLTYRAPSGVPAGGHAHCCLLVPPGLPPTPALRTFWPFWPELPLARAHTRVPFCTCSDTEGQPQDMHWTLALWTRRQRLTQRVLQLSLSPLPRAAVCSGCKAAAAAGSGPVQQPRGR